MSREVRRVPKGWEHPSEWVTIRDWNTGVERPKRYARPLYKHDSYEVHVKDWESMTPEEREDDPYPDPTRYMPDFSGVPDDQMGWCMYETTSEGTPISPVMDTPEELAHWLTDNNASAFGEMTATYDQWLATIHAGWAPSGIIQNGTITSGVAASKEN